MNIPSLWILRVGDGENLRNSKYPFWGVKRGKNGSIKSIVTKMLIGDILCFMTSKQYGGKIIGMCEYTGFYDRKDEPLLQINTKSNLEQQWTGDDSWDIQIHYNNFHLFWCRGNGANRYSTKEYFYHWFTCIFRFSYGRFGYKVWCI